VRSASACRTDLPSVGWIPRGIPAFPFEGRSTGKGPRKTIFPLRFFCCSSIKTAKRFSPLPDPMSRQPLKVPPDGPRGAIRPKMWRSEFADIGGSESLKILVDGPLTPALTSADVP
jgi:hypothetical protein